MKNDILYRGTIHANHFRLFAAETTKLVQTARDLHDFSPLSAILMGRMLTAAALMSGELKAPKSELSLRIKADGPLEGGVALADKEGNLRAYAYQPQLWLQPAIENFNVGKNLGEGILTVMKQSGLKAPYNGNIELVSGEIGEDIAQYYLISEQIPSVVNLGFLMDKEAKIRAAGGFIIQQMPFAEPKVADIINENIAATPNVSDLMDMGLSILDILGRFVLKGLEYEITQESPIRYQCNCSRESFARALMLLGKSELEDMQAGIEPICHYCNKVYHFAKEDIMAILKLIEEQE